ncbi:MAG: glycosyltransferase family 39 protein, partial [Acidobacteriota bacterium]|nr:glycosyltransferase family 39 protein [Acidobacteriota bacterium]
MWGAVIFAVALIVRLAHLWAIRDAAVFEVLLGDAHAYDGWAQRLAGGDWIGTDVFYQAPLYPYFLGVLYALAGRDLVLVRVVQAIVGSGAAVLLTSAGTRLFSRRVGLLAGFGLALYAPAIFFDGLLQKSVLDVFFMCATLWVASRLVDRPRDGWLWLALGMTMGALSLTRENALALVVVALVWSLLAGRWRKDRRHEAQDEFEGHAVGLRALGDIRLRGLAAPALLLCGLAAVLLPVVARNYAVTGGFYLTTSQFGPNFYIGNNPASDGTYMSLRP